MQHSDHQAMCPHLCHQHSMFLTDVMLQYICFPFWPGIGGLSRVNKPESYVRLQADLAWFLQIDALPITNHFTECVYSYYDLVFS